MPHSKQRHATVGLTLPYRLSQHMPFRQEIKFLRDRAQRLREMADYQTPLSDRLRTIAAELDALADRAERGEPGTGANRV